MRAIEALLLKIPCGMGKDPGAALRPKVYTDQAQEFFYVGVQDKTPRPRNTVVKRFKFKTYCWMKIDLSFLGSCVSFSILTEQKATESNILFTAL